MFVSCSIVSEGRPEFFDGDQMEKLIKNNPGYTWIITDMPHVSHMGLV